MLSMRDVKHYLSPETHQMYSSSSSSTAPLQRASTTTDSPLHRTRRHSFRASLRRKSEDCEHLIDSNRDTSVDCEGGGRWTEEGEGDEEGRE